MRARQPVGTNHRHAPTLVRRADTEPMHEPALRFYDRRVMPALILVETRAPGQLVDEFGRYARDYDLRTADDGRRGGARRRTRSARRAARWRCSSRSHSCPTPPCSRPSPRWRAVVPTARRLIAAHWSRFLTDAPTLRAGLAKGKYDAYLLMPRGVRDEEFHTAVCELLSDWGSTVATPEVVSVRIVSARGRRPDARDPRLPRPHGAAQPRLPARQRRRAARCSPALDGRARAIRSCEAMDKLPDVAASRCATSPCASTASPPTSTSTRSSTSPSSEPDRPGSRRPSTPRRRA